MNESLSLTVNGQIHSLNVDPQTPLIFVLRNDLGLKGPKLGCAQEQCHACAVLIDGAAVPSCHLPVGHVANLEITTVEGLGTADNLHPLQEAFLEEQAGQCGFCTAGMIISAQGLLNRQRYPSDTDIKEAMSTNLCRCGTYDRVRRAILLRTGRFDDERPSVEMVNQPPLDNKPPIPLNSASFAANGELDQWIKINSDQTISVFTGKVEIGQGLRTALAQIAAEELDVALARIRMESVDTAGSPNEGVTAGSRSLETSGIAIRQAAADARRVLLDLAFEVLDAQTAASELIVHDATITDPVTGRSTTYWDLHSDRLFGPVKLGIATPKSADQHTQIGQSVPRIDLVAKVTGQPSYVHDIDLPGMAHARVVRPPSYASQLVDIDLSALKNLGGVIELIRDGSFLAVVAEREEQAVWAAEAVKAAAQWQVPDSLPSSQEDVYKHLRQNVAGSYPVIDGAAVADRPLSKPLHESAAAQTLKATYRKPFHMHGSLGPSAAVAVMTDGQLTVYAQTQGVFPQRQAIATSLGLDINNVRVVHVEGAGSYGHSGAEDAAFDAAFIAVRVPGRPISLKWTRADEHGWEPYGSAMVVDMQADLDVNGRLLNWNHDVYSYTHLNRPRPGSERSGFIADWHKSQPIPPPDPKPFFVRHIGGYRNADPLYSFEQKRIGYHFVPDSPLRVSALRSLGAFGNVFAIESFMDELAHAAGQDPVEFRLAHLEDQRARDVVEAVAAKANWGKIKRKAGYGRGFAFAQYKNIQSYTAMVVDVHVDKSTGYINLISATIAADAGQVVNPNGLSNQFEGGFMQAASWSLHEEVTFNHHKILSQDWESYPILRFENAPIIETIILNRPDQPFLGSGETTTGPTPAAIGNAIFDACGVRLRQAPFRAADIVAKRSTK